MDGCQLLLKLAAHTSPLFVELMAPAKDLGQLGGQFLLLLR
ncbi:hypothetical protein [Streptomyces sp. NPDC058268]